RAHARGALDAADRAAVLSGAHAVFATSALAAWPWRVVEAMALAVPIVAVDSGVHRDVLADGGVLAPAEEFTDAAVAALEEASSRRLRVLAADRARAFSWASSAERVWSLHAEL
ncbi:MAG: glycosyltransferase, partial [Microbacterium sp.]